MEDDIFQKIKQIPITNVFQDLGYKVSVKGNKGWCKSPFKAEKTPSCCIYINTNSWYCYSSNIGGDSVKLYKELFKYSNNLESAKALAERFGISFNSGKNKVPSKVIAKHRFINDESEIIKIGLTKLYHKLCLIYRLFNELVRELEADAEVDKTTLTYNWFIFNLDFFDRATDLFVYGDIEDRIDFYKNYEKKYRREWEIISKWLMK